MLFATGSSLSEISKSTGIKEGTLAAESARKGWMAEREKVQSLVRTRLEETQAVLATMPERAKNWVSRVAAQSNKALEIIEKEPIETLKDVSRVTSVLDHVDKVARRSYGLDQDDGAGRTIVNLGFLQDYAPPAIEISKPLTLENQAD